MEDFSEQSRKKAENSVLRFARAPDLGLISIKPIKLSTLMPMTLVSRYNRKVDELTYCQTTPAFLIPK